MIYNQVVEPLRAQDHREHYQQTRPNRIHNRLAGLSFLHFEIEESGERV